jgi:hypothetical protein
MFYSRFFKGLLVGFLLSFPKILYTQCLVACFYLLLIMSIFLGSLGYQYRHVSMGNSTKIRTELVDYPGWSFFHESVT